MPIAITIQPVLLEFTPQQRDAWVAGDRSDCLSRYCAGISGGEGVGGFGEYIAGRYWQDQGYIWEHHDFDIIGANKDGMYESQSMLETSLGAKCLADFKASCQSLWPFAEEHHGPLEQPDLMICKPDGSGLRFAECKRFGSRDRVNPRQAMGLFLIASQLHVPVDVYIVAEQGKCFEPLEAMVFEFDELGSRLAG